MEHLVRAHRREPRVLASHINRRGGVGDLRIDLTGEEIGGGKLVAVEADRCRLGEHVVGETVVQPASVVADLEAGAVEVRKRLEAPLVGAADQQQLPVAHIGFRKRGDPCTVERPSHPRHCDVELVGGEVSEHRAERHLHIFELDAERRVQRVQHIHVEATEISARGIAHAEHGRVHRRADPQHAAVEDHLQPIRRLALRGRRQRGDEGGGDAEHERSKVHHGARL
jgi:hypothetical protein